MSVCSVRNVFISFISLLSGFIYSAHLSFFFSRSQLKLNFNCVCDNSNFKVYGIPLLTELALNNINFRVIHHMLYLSERMAKFVLWVFFFFSVT